MYLEESVGQKIWVIGGTTINRKMNYTLLSYFTPDSIIPLTEGGYNIKGTGIVFSPPIDLSSKPWFSELFIEEQDFSLGINEIKDDDILEGLLANALNYLMKLSVKMNNLIK
ncbi:hypothetical protein GCM10028774_37790 [Spirosoma jeollabukense]